MYLVELAAKLGLFTKARRHLRIAQELLSTVDHRELFVNVGLTEIALTAQEGDLQLALEQALELVDRVEEVGSAAASFAIATNLGHLLLAQTRYIDAQRWIQKALQTVLHSGGQGGGPEVALRDTLMLLHICNGDLIEAEAEAERVQQLLRESGDHDTFFGLWHVATRVKWLYRASQVREGLNEAQIALPRVERMADRSLLQRLQLLVAEGYSLTDRHDEAAETFAQIVRSTTDPSFESIAEFARLRGILVAASNPIEARLHFDHAANIFAGIGNLAVEAEVRADAERLCGITETDKNISAASAPITHADRLSSLIGIASHPRLIGAALFSLVKESTAATHARLLERLHGDWREIMNSGAIPDAHAALSIKPPVTIQLGVPNREYAIEIQPGSRPSDWLTVLAIEELARAARAIDRSRQLEREQAAIWPEPVVEEQLGLVSASERTVDLINKIRRVANTNLTILLVGESGVGKELYARALHQASSRKDRAFLPFNCAGVPKDMFESQLFGHRRGAFTGAHEEGPGVIRAAAGGTLFLDEIGELSLDVQPKLLRFLESGEIHPIGESKPQQVDVRVVAATNKDLEQLVSDGKFREDLYYRLNVLPIRIPPLRERREEIPALVEHFLEKYGREMQKPMLRVADETLEYLLLYRWPGNVRQLANELRRVIALTEPGDVMMPSHLSPDIIASRRTLPVQPSEVVIDLGQPLQQATNQLERAAIERALKAANGNNDEAAKALGLSRKGLYLKRQRLGLK
jgi:DNA-binding NtrC family response regulator